MDPIQQLNDFFDAYAARFNAALAGTPVDLDGTTHAFSECFIEASPLGVNCGKNDAGFREAIPKGYDFYRSIGTKSMDITDREITLLNELHAMVKIYWHSVYRKKSDEEEVIDFEVFYFLQQRDNAWKIFAYITGDEQAVLKERGLIPEDR